MITLLWTLNSHQLFNAIKYLKLKHKKTKIRGNWWGCSNKSQREVLTPGIWALWIAHFDLHKYSWMDQYWNLLQVWI